MIDLHVLPGDTRRQGAFFGVRGLNRFGTARRAAKKRGEEAKRGKGKEKRKEIDPQIAPVSTDKRKRTKTRGPARKLVF